MIKEALQEYLEKMKADPFYRLTANVQEADRKESTEVLDEIGQMTDDDMTIVSSEHIKPKDFSE
ncbi:MAG: hypothetical protein IK016_11275 [Lachnospiraceae bacterium]|nr:hypothetical protein [Lachnospiraceae bacterium]